MFPRLRKYIKKVTGHDDLQKLSEEEKTTYDKWNAILTTPDATVKQIEELLEELKRKAISDIADPENSTKKDAKTKAMITICESLLVLIQSPRANREQLEKHIDSLLQ